MKCELIILALMKKFVRRRKSWCLVLRRNYLLLPEEVEPEAVLVVGPTVAVVAVVVVVVPRVMAVSVSGVVRSVAGSVVGAVPVVVVVSALGDEGVLWRALEHDGLGGREVGVVLRLGLGHNVEEPGLPRRVRAHEILKENPTL